MNRLIGLDRFRSAHERELELTRKPPPFLYHRTPPAPKLSGLISVSILAGETQGCQVRRRECGESIPCLISLRNHQGGSVIL
jgi:hypothetical protein